MLTIRDLLKERVTYSVEAGQTVLDTARYMVEHNIGAVPVIRDAELAGIFSERDIMTRVVAEHRDPATTRVADVMTPHPLCVSADTTLAECMLLMKKHGFRHLPICEGPALKGLISLRDLLLKDLEEKDGEVQMMRAYIHTNT